MVARDIIRKITNKQFFITRDEKEKRSKGGKMRDGELN
jgi:hypothetical protein